jgi:Uma2 family endonuclease
MPPERSYVPGMPPASPASVTAEELLALSMPHKRVELVRGVLIVREPAGYAHGRVAMNLAVRLATYVESAAAGQVFAAETGFTLARGPDTVRAPDIAFVRRDRLPEPATQGFPDLAPDLVVEVLSPDDRPGDVLAKVADWLTAGTRLVWTVDPQRRLARVYRHDGSETSVTAEGALDGEDALPGFTCSLVSIL